MQRYDSLSTVDRQSRGSRGEAIARARLGSLRSSPADPVVVLIASHRIERVVLIEPRGSLVHDRAALIEACNALNGRLAY